MHGKVPTNGLNNIFYALFIIYHQGRRKHECHGCLGAHKYFSRDVYNDQESIILLFQFANVLVLKAFN